jgi:hypothetical protein
MSMARDGFDEEDLPVLSTSILEAREEARKGGGGGANLQRVVQKCVLFLTWRTSQSENCLSFALSLRREGGIPPNLSTV